jgi:hypothetical protein
MRGLASEGNFWDYIRLNQHLSRIGLNPNDTLIQKQLPAVNLRYLNDLLENPKGAWVEDGSLVIYDTPKLFGLLDIINYYDNAGFVQLSDFGAYVVPQDSKLTKFVEDFFDKPIVKKYLDFSLNDIRLYDMLHTYLKNENNSYDSLTFLCNIHKEINEFKEDNEINKRVSYENLLDLKEVDFDNQFIKENVIEPLAFLLSDYKAPYTKELAGDYNVSLNKDNLWLIDSIEDISEFKHLANSNLYYFG